MQSEDKGAVVFTFNIFNQVIVLHIELQRRKKRHTSSLLSETWYPHKDTSRQVK